ncbi:branched-chain amino acid ABC transporter permease [Halobacterium sp. KA-6]|uniref:branched-chain amino acid ABC transporter permease n=1 Tax=Halobacterium sp. KA-6 TaxID=2896368 RepID=UPI001E3655EC|nr:branched-chain amino acid ABC transporter permease [Halobacterium sp. KA-6]MCD2205060.1 branched-chain amino acid ABC transporter permease [Halobacterium sp. KA-6]
MSLRSIAADPKAYWSGLTRAEQGVTAFIIGVVGLLLFGLLTGGLAPTYFLFLLGLAGMYALMSLGLNVQWGYTGLINFSVAAFFGIGAYGTALASSSSSPLAGDLAPVVGLLVALVLAAILALLIAIPTLRLRADYLAIASIGLAEVVRIIILNEDQVTNGSAGLRGIPTFFEGWPVLDTLPQTMPGIVISWLPGGQLVLGQSFWSALLNVALVLAFIAGSYFVLKRAHRSPWGRVLRTIRSDEDLASALGKNTYHYKMQAFVLGSLVMALAGVFYAHLNLYVSPGDLNPITTFYVWVAVILGGSGSNRGALFGGFVIVAIREGTRFLNAFEWIPFDVAPLRLLLIGVLIVLLMRFRPQGVLPPQRELIWPSVVDNAPEKPDTGVRDVKAGETND